MTTRCACALNGLGLQDIDPSICVIDIREGEPEMTVSTAVNPRRDGARLLRMQRRSLRVAVEFEIHEYDPARRKAVAARICDWAGEGFLTVSDRPGQRLYAVCDRLPVIPSALQWTDRLTVSFIACAPPYWQDEVPFTAAFQGKTGSVFLNPGGGVPCCLEAEIQAAEEAVNALTVSAGGRSLSFSGLGMRKGETLEIGYENGTGRQYLRVGGRSAMRQRTAESADDLLLRPGVRNEIAVTADHPVKARFQARGLHR